MYDLHINSLVHKLEKGKKFVKKNIYQIFVSSTRHLKGIKNVHNQAQGRIIQNDSPQSSEA